MKHKLPPDAVLYLDDLVLRAGSLNKRWLIELSKTLHRYERLHYSTDKYKRIYDDLNNRHESLSLRGSKNFDGDDIPNEPYI